MLGFAVGLPFCVPNFRMLILASKCPNANLSTKFDARIRRWTPFLCAKFQGDRNTRLLVIAIFASVRKDEEKKTKKNKPTLWQLVSRKWLERFPSNLECRLPLLAGNCVANLVAIRQVITEIQRCENDIFVLPVNILTGVARRLLGPHDTLPCVLICIIQYDSNCILGITKVWGFLPYKYHPKPA